MEMNSKSGYDAERGVGMGYEESQLVDSIARTKQPRKFSTTLVTEASPDYMRWSTISLFVCFMWGILAFIASNKVRKFNSMKAYNEAHYYSKTALRHNQSAVACFVVLIFILGVPLSISLAVQGSITKFPSAREFFG